MKNTEHTVHLPGDGEWSFIWTTGTYGWLNHTESGWVLEGRPNAVPDTGWVVAHDIFHHAPSDTGSYREEVMTFGAETWMMGPDAHDKEIQMKIADSWYGVIMLVLENGTRGARGLLLDRFTGRSDSGNAGIAPQAHLHELWASAYRMAIADARDSHGELADPSLWERLGGDRNVAVACALVAQGYSVAQARWPDVDLARDMFSRVKREAGRACDGDRLVVRIQGGEMEIEKISTARMPEESQRSNKPMYPR